MIRIFIFDQSRPVTLATDRFGLPEEERLASISSPKRRMESLSALAALSELIKISFGELHAEILRDTNGKPYFKDSDIYFSLSHAGTVSVAALSDEKDNVIGVDIEKITNLPNMEAFAKRFFNDGELEAFLLSRKNPTTFFEIWTKKESFAKMTGLGLSSLIASQADASPLKDQCYSCDFYNNSDRYSLSLSSSLKISSVEIYTNSDTIRH